MLDRRTIEHTFHITKYMLLEIAPLFPFLMDRFPLHCIEVGANVGMWCEGFMRIYGDQVASFNAYEPMPANVSRFRERLRRHLSKYADVIRLHDVCVGDKSHEVEIFYHRPVTPWASVVLKQMKVGNQTIVNDKTLSVRQVTLDEQIERLQLEKVHLVKIDVEGYEWNVIEGMKRSLDLGRVENVYFEFGIHQESVAQTFKQFFDFFKSRNYTIFKQVRGRNFFGLNKITTYTPEFEDKSSIWMILASLHGPSNEYNGPRVVGRLN